MVLDFVETSCKTWKFSARDLGRCSLGLSLYSSKNILADIDTKQETSYYSFQLIKGFPSWHYGNKSSYKWIAGGKKYKEKIFIQINEEWIKLINF